jgi:hypothetical protein
MLDRDKKLIKIQKRIEEVESDGNGKVVVFIKKGIICEWQTIKEDKYNLKKND